MKRFKRYLGLVREACACMPDRRTGKNLMYRIGDIGMAAFACFFMQSPSFLAFQRMLEDRCGDSNARTLFGMERIPCDNHIRQTLDGVPPEHFDGISVVRDLDRKGALRGMRRLKDRTLIALDGTEYFNSDKFLPSTVPSFRRPDCEFPEAEIGIRCVAFHRDQLDRSCGIPHPEFRICRQNTIHETGATLWAPES